MRGMVGGRDTVNEFCAMVPSRGMVKGDADLTDLWEKVLTGY